MSVNFAQLNDHLAKRSYIEGYTPSQADVHVSKAIPSPPDAKSFPHVHRWYIHINSYSSEHTSLPGSSNAGEAFLGSAGASATKAEEIDLFGSDEDDDEEAERVKAQRVAEYNEKKAKKPKTIAKSVVTLDVKGWDDETDMKALEEKVREIQMDGLVWGSSKFVPVGYGISKLQITVVIEDDKVSLDELQERVAEDEEHVQSTDVAAMQKL